MALNEKAKFCSECGTAVSAGTRPAEYKQVTVLFADVVHSMNIAAAVGPERLREIMAELVNITTAVVQRYGGTVDKFTGDGIMAVFGAPIALEDHAIRACLAALGIQEETKGLAARVKRRDGTDFQLRVGLNSGQVIAGEIGSQSLGYTTIGEQVGMAQRMESVAPHGGVMLSASTARLVEGVATLGEVERVRIKGTDQPVSAQQLLGVPERRDAVGQARVESCWSAMGDVGRRGPAGACYRRPWCGGHSGRFTRYRQEPPGARGGGELLPGAEWRCSAPTANRTGPTSPSTSWRGCCGPPSACMA